MSAKRTNKLSSCSVNKTVVFYSPIEGRDVLVRTGIIEEDSFIHALLHATSSKYVQMQNKDRIKLANKFYSKVSSDIYKNQLVNKSSFQDHLLNIVKDFYEFVVKEKLPKDKNSKYIIQKFKKKFY